MAFAAPFMLIGLVGLAVPIIIHLMHRSRSAVVDWPTLRFLKVAQQRSAQRSRLKHLLVLLARLVLLALVVLAMAKPYRPDPTWTPPPDLPTTLVIVLDRSYSMGYREPGRTQTRFERAKQLAAEQVAALSQEDELALVLADDRPIVLTDRPTRDHQRVEQLIRDATLSKRGTNIGSALTTAFALARMDALEVDVGPHEASDEPVVRPPRPAWRQVLLISDMQRVGWSGLLRGGLMETIEQPAPVTVLNVGAESSPNRWIKKVGVANDSPGTTVRIDVELGNPKADGDVLGSAQVRLWIDDQPAGSPAIVGRSRKIQFAAAMPPPGVHRCVVQIDEDRLPIDDRATLALEVSGGQRLTIVSGDPSSLVEASETFFFEAALGARRGEDGGLAVRHLTIGQLSRAPLDHAGALVLANVASLDGSAITHVERFLRRGGRVLVTMGDQVDIEHVGRDWSFLPVQPTGVLPASARSAAYEMVVEMPDHPIFKGRLDFSATRFFSFVSSDPTALRHQGRVLASFSNGSPAMIEGSFARPLGRGPNVILLTTGLDADWSNLPHRRVFVPLVDRIARYLTRRRLDQRTVVIGRPVRFSGPAALDGTQMTITAPDGQGQNLTARLDAASGQAVVDYQSTDHLGLYRVQADPRFDNAEAFAVNLDPRESNLRPADPDLIREAFADHAIRFVTQRPTALGAWHAPGAARPPDPTDTSEHHTRYWPWLLLAAFIVFVLETLLANLFTRRRRPPAIPSTEYISTRRTEGALAGSR